jgi:hypothetical protein
MNEMIKRELMRWETDGGRPAGAAHNTSVVHGDRRETPVIYVRRPADEAAARRETRALARRLGFMDLSGIVVATSHWMAAGDTPNVVITIGARSDADGFALAERVGELMKEGGLYADFEGFVDLDDGGWKALERIGSDSAIPVVRVSVPANFGADLMRLAGRALRPLRSEGVLLAAAGARVEADLARRVAEGDVTTLKSMARMDIPARAMELQPMLFVLGASESRAKSARKPHKLKNRKSEFTFAEGVPV